jgi:hypothetical protein
LLSFRISRDDIHLCAIRQHLLRRGGLCQWGGCGLLPKWVSCDLVPDRTGLLPDWGNE